MWWLAVPTAYVCVLLVVYRRRKREMRIPEHVAFIMDGNRRYGAREFGMVRHLEGHEAGGRKLGLVCEWCVDFGIREMTCFAFSTENWNRSPKEIETLMATFIDKCAAIEAKAHEKRVRVRVMSTNDRLPERVKIALTRLVDATSEYDTLTLNLAISYGGRSEIVNAAKEVARRVRDGLDVDTVDEATFATFLTLQSAPDVLIRTSGEFRLSNFLLWQLAYTELVFLDKFWPDIEKKDLEHAFRIFASRKRRFGV